MNSMVYHKGHAEFLLKTEEPILWGESAIAVGRSLIPNPSANFVGIWKGVFYYEKHTKKMGYKDDLANSYD